MTKTLPYHTNSPEYPPQHRAVYHDHSDCPDGKRIEQKHRLPGTGNKGRCDKCKQLG